MARAFLPVLAGLTVLSAVVALVAAPDGHGGSLGDWLLTAVSLMALALGGRLVTSGSLSQDLVGASADVAVRVVPLVLTVVVLFTAPPLAFLTSVVVFAGLFLGVEAVAHGRLLAFLGGLVLVAVLGAGVTALVVGLLYSWRAVLAVLLVLGALVLSVVNLRELRRG